MTVYAHVRVHVRVCVMCVPKLCCHGELFGKGILRATSAEHIKMHFKNQNSSYTHRLCLEGNTKNWLTVVTSGEENGGGGVSEPRKTYSSLHTV